MSRAHRWILPQNTVSYYVTRDFRGLYTDLHLSIDLFRRLRELRGNKTMIFSSHRFGNLTRHADVIL